MGEEVVPAIVEGYASQVIDASLFGGKILKKISLQILALLVCSVRLAQWLVPLTPTNSNIYFYQPILETRTKRVFLERIIKY